MYNKKLTLSNGVEIPQLGLGTRFIDDDKVADAVKALQISATDILTLHRLTEMSVVSAKESVHVVFREKNYSLYPKLLQSIKLMKMPKQAYGKSDSSSHQQHSSGTY